MILSSYIIKFPYWLVFKILKKLKRTQKVVIYLGNYQDYKVIENVLPQLKYPYILCSKNSKLKKELNEMGVKSLQWPVWADTVIMARHALHKFPIKEIKKVGMRHGPYHFKEFISSKKYNAFDLFLFTSTHEVKLANQRLITKGVAGGYPKLDSIKRAALECSNKIKKAMSPNKKLILFSATWKGSNMSAVDKWIDRLPEISQKFNIAVTLHPMMEQSYFKKVANTKNVTLVSQDELNEYLGAADYLVSDTSSIIAEFCALNKPIITFKVHENNNRLTSEIKNLIKSISVGIDSFDEFEKAVESYEKNPDLLRENREKANIIMFDDVDTNHADKAAEIINNFLIL